MIYRSCIRSNGTDCQAIYSPCERYRFKLSIVWDATKPRVNFLMLNPSTATELANDPTVNGCEQRARDWGFGGLIVTNIFAFRATDPRLMILEENPVGTGNDHFILEAAREAARETAFVVCAWGNHGQHLNRGSQVREMLRHYEIVGVRCLAVNKSGEPKHPLYIARSVPAVRWE